MSRNDPDKLLGIGLYSPREAAAYVRCSTQKLTRWFYGTAKGEPVLSPQLGSESERIVTFLDFAQSLSVNEIRLSIGIPLRKIRAAYTAAQKEFGVKFPLAVENGVFVFGDLARPNKCELAIYLPDRGHDAEEWKQERLAAISDRCVQLTGKHKGNFLISKVVRQFSHNLVFGADGVATRYVAFKHHRHNIVMDPQVRFGKPYLEDSGYEAQTLADAVQAEKSVERVAKLYRVEVAAVRAALEYQQLLKTPPLRTPPKRNAA